MEGIRALSVAPHRLRVEFLCLITLRHKRRASILLCNPMASAVAYKLRFPGLFSTSEMPAGSLDVWRWSIRTKPGSIQSHPWCIGMEKCVMAGYHLGFVVLL